VVARALGAQGTLVLNADDPVLAAMPVGIAPKVTWFSAAAGRTDAAAAIVNGHGVIRLDGATHDIGAINDMPITLHGAAPHNVSNILGAALLAAVLGVPFDAIRHVCETFGKSPRDNPGRLQVSHVGGVTVLTDYAHNPGGLAALCATAASMHAKRRLLLLGQAGNRDDEQVRELARAALDVTRFDRVIIKEMPSMLRGREVGDLSRLFHDELLRGGMHEDQLEIVVGEREAIRHAMAWAKGGDLLVCPVHVERAGVHAWLNMLAVTGWHAGHPVPE
ncbi:MAG: cyanophycin synthetase, partial [Gemmatimonadaceae bacterium]